MARARTPRPTGQKTSNNPKATDSGSGDEAAGQRLQKVLAQAGLGSRRQLDQAILEGRVRVDGQVAIAGLRVLGTERITFDGKAVRLPAAKNAEPTRVIVYHKPAGVVCSRSDPEGRPTCFEALPRLHSSRWLSVGRLDIATTGLLLFTNDGDLAHHLAHPSACLDREYVVRVRGELDDEAIARLLNGVVLDDGPAAFSDITAGRAEGSNRWYYVTLFDGRNREVRRLFETQGVVVSRLKRVRFGPISLPAAVRRGETLELSRADVSALAGLVGFEPARLPTTPTTRSREKTKPTALVGVYPPLDERQSWRQELDSS